MPTLPFPAGPPAPCATDPAPVAAAAPSETPPGRTCPNCGTPAPMAYCPACGQAQHALHRSLRAWADELLDTFAGWDGKIPTTLWLLFRYPGRLTVEYLAGRRARYLPPLRLYLSLALLLVLARRVGPPSGELIAINMSAQPPAAGSVSRSADRPEAGRIDPELTQSGPWRKLKQGVFGARLTTLERMLPAERNAALVASFRAKVGNMFFALVPVFALLLRGVYRRRPLVYAEHLVVALHLHAFAAGALTLAALLPRGAWRAAPALWVPAYLLLALRAVYGGSRLGTLARVAVLGAGYLVAFVAALGVTGLLTFLVG